MTQTHGEGETKGMNLKGIYNHSHGARLQEKLLLAHRSVLSKGIISFCLLPQVVELNKFLHTTTQHLQVIPPMTEVKQIKTTSVKLY